jgi:hypothetical protein
MFLTRQLTVTLLTVAFGMAQEPVVMKYSGTPLQLPYECNEDDIEWAGMVCTEQEPCPIFLELSAIGSAGRKIFAGGNLHSSTTSLYSVLLQSDDAGVTWKEAAPRDRGASVDQIQFADLEHGWAGGEVQVPLPQDPFFLVTSDGGLSWRNRPVTEDGGPGLVQRFWFDTGQHGELIVDAGKTAEGGQYREYETETGGDTWMIRGATTQMPKLRREPPLPPEPYFRARAAKDGKSLLIEKRTGDQWDTASAFLIQVASCVTKTVDMTEPTAEELEKQNQPAKDYVDVIDLGGTAKGKKPAAKKKPPVVPPVEQDLLN